MMLETHSEWNHSFVFFSHFLQTKKKTMKEKITVTIGSKSETEKTKKAIRSVMYVNQINSMKKYSAHEFQMQPRNTQISTAFNASSILDCERIFRAITADGKFLLASVQAKRSNGKQTERVKMSETEIECKIPFASCDSVAIFFFSFSESTLIYHKIYKLHWKEAGTMKQKQRPRWNLYMISSYFLFAFAFAITSTHSFSISFLFPVCVCMCMWDYFKFMGRCRLNILNAHMYGTVQKHFAHSQIE